MNTLDKICVAPHQITDYDLDIQQIGHNGAEEYIRKNTLMEWAKEHQEGERQGSYTWSCYQIIIDKLNSL